MKRGVRTGLNRSRAPVQVRIPNQLLRFARVSFLITFESEKFESD